MARAHLRHTIKDEAGNVIQNAAVFVYQPGTTTAPSGTMHNAVTGGAVITNPLISNNQGDIEAWFSDKQTVDLLITDNTDGAYYPSDPSRKLSWTEFREAVPILPAPEDIGGAAVTSHSALTGLGADDHPQYDTGAEVDAKITTHAGLPDPHTGYLTDTAFSAHQAAADAHPAYATDTDLTAHGAAADPHTGYQKETEKGVANGYASLGSDGKVPASQFPAGSDVSAHEGAADPHTGYQKESELLFVRKTADESVLLSTTLQDDDSLLLALLANGVYEFEAFIIYDASATADIKLAFTVPSGATLFWNGSGIQGTSDAFAAAEATAITASGTSQTYSGVVGTQRVVKISGLVVVGATAGNLTLQWAQAATDAVSTTVKTGSFLKARKAP